VKVGDRGNGGILKIGPEMGDAPPHWAVYFASNDVDASVEAVTNAGGSVMVPAFDTPPVGRVAVVADPQGAPLCLITLAMPAD